MRKAIMVDEGVDNYFAVTMCFAEEVQKNGLYDALVMVVMSKS